MLKSELQQLIQNGENSGVEFKRDDVRPEQLAKEVVAMANMSGGRVLIGVEDDGTVSGITRPDLEAWILDTIFGRYIHPNMIPFYEEVQWDAEKRVAVLSFPMGVSKPYVVRHKDREDIYVRVGGQSRLATREQQARLFASGGLLHAELMPVAGTDMNTLDRVRLHNYLAEILNDPEIPDSDDAWQKRLLGLGFLVEGENGDIHCSVAGLVLFGIRPRRFLRQAGLRWVAYPGRDKDYAATTDQVLDAPLVGRWGTLQGSKTLIDEGLIEQFAAAARPFLLREGGELKEGFRRESNPRFPTEAIREVVINALAHRDWSRATDVEVNLYADRLEVISPGALPNSMTVEKMIAGQRSPRNPIIVEVLRDYGYVDARGMGIRTKVIPLMRAMGSEPEFRATEDALQTILRQGDPAIALKNAPKEENASKFAPKTLLQRQILAFIRANPSISYEILAQETGKAQSTIRRNIQKLKGMGLLERRGGRKGGVWRVL